MTDLPTKKISGLYGSSLLLAILINSFLDWLICTIFHFDTKSAICIYLYGGFGFAFKATFFFLPYLFLKKYQEPGKEVLQVVFCWLPFLLFFSWFALIVVFNISALFFELEFGYIMRFPHCLLQLLSVLACCIVATVRVRLRQKKTMASSPTE
jgi:hypothetical protein